MEDPEDAARQSPSVTPSMRHALTDLDLTHLIVIHAGRHRFPLSDDITAVPAADVLTRGVPAAIEDR